MDTFFKDFPKAGEPLNANTIMQEADELIQQLMYSNIVYGESAVLVNENGIPHILTPEELDELHREYDFSQMEPINFDEIKTEI